MPRLKKTELFDYICVDLEEKDFEKLKRYAAEHNTKMVRVLEKYIDGLRIPTEPRKARLSYEGNMGNVVKRTFKVRPETKQRVERYAEMYGINISAVIRRYVVNLK